MTLHALNSATAPSSNEDDYVPGEDVRYAQQLAEAGYTVEDVPDEFIAGGWTPNAVPDTGGSPVRFE